MFMMRGWMVGFPRRDPPAVKCEGCLAGRVRPVAAPSARARRLSGGLAPLPPAKREPKPVESKKSSTPKACEGQ